MDAHGDDNGAGVDLQRRAEPPVEGGGVEIEARVAAAVEGPGLGADRWLFEQVQGNGSCLNAEVDKMSPAEVVKASRA
jgi:hypothetical protein